MKPEKSTKSKKPKNDDKPVPNNRNPFAVYMRTVLGIVGVFALLVSLGLFVYAKTVKNNAPIPAAVPETSSAANTPEQNQTQSWDGSILNGVSIIEAPDKTNFLIVGTDATGMLTDVIIIGCYDRHLEKFTLISIPRDTRTVMSAEDIEILKNAGKRVPSGGVMKLNAVHSYAGRENGILFTKKQIESMFGIKIDYYAEISLKAFKNVVDAVGGIYMEVPNGGLYYNDPAQDLVIAVPGGMQLLDGTMAEGVVRYRNTYPRGDVQRIEVQQEFMKQFFAQALTKEKIMSNPTAFLSTVINYVSTDFTIVDLPKYIKHIDALNAESIDTYTMPGHEATMGGASYFIIDDEKSQELVDEVFIKDNAPVSETEERPEPEQEQEETDPEQTQPEQTQPETPATDIKSLKIQILNGTNTDGLAAEKAEMLRQLGFNVINVGNYYGEKQVKTRIMTKQSGDYAGFEKLFKDVSIQTDPDINEKYDCVIILGSSE